MIESGTIPTARVTRFETAGTSGVKSLGHLNVPSRIAVDASQLYARNLLAFLALLVDKEGNLRIDTADEIVKARQEMFSAVTEAQNLWEQIPQEERQGLLPPTAPQVHG